MSLVYGLKIKQVPRKRRINPRIKAVLGCFLKTTGKVQIVEMRIKSIPAIIFMIVSTF